MNASRITSSLLGCSFAFIVVACGGGNSEQKQKDSPAATEEKRAELVKQYAARTESERASRREQLKGELDAAERDVSDAKTALDELKKKHKVAIASVITPQKDAEFKKKIAAQTVTVNETSAKRDKAKRAVAQVENWVPRTNPHDLKPGNVTKFGVERDGEINMPVFVVFQIVDRANILAKFGDEIFWVENVSALSADEGKTVSFEGIIECTGTKEYANPLGGVRIVKAFRHYDTK